MNSSNYFKIHLSETEAGKCWLQQFAQKDIDAAKLLLESLIFVSNNEFIKGIQTLIENFLEQYSGVVALFAAREVDKNSGTNERYFENQSERPISINAHRMVGSEGIITNLCRDLSFSNSSRILDHPSINLMRKKQCRWLLSLDDIIGSGWRMSKFINWLYDDPHIKSWISFGLVNFVSVTYTATSSGIGYVKSKSRNDVIKYCQGSLAGRSTWTDEQKKAVEDLCIRYAKYTSNPQKPLGHEKKFTLTIFQHKCPNTVPAILWASKKNSWFGLFSERPELVLNQWPTKQHYQDEILRSLGHTQLTTSSLFSKLNRHSKNLVLLLACLAMRKRNEHILSDMLQLSIPEISIMIAKCKEYGWIGSERYLTETGRNVFETAKKNNYLSSIKIEINDEFCYPKTLRSPAGSSSSVFQNGENHGCQT